MAATYGGAGGGGGAAGYPFGMAATGGGGGGGGGGMAATAPLPSTLLASSGVAPEELRHIIAAKERELHDINEFRQQSLEGVIADKVRAVLIVAAAAAVPCP